MRQSSAHHRGISLVMVTMFVAVASVMGMAILSSNSLQTMVSSGQAQAVQADALAESGVNLGLYYLQNISDMSKCPVALVLGGSSYGATNVSFGSAVPGTVDLSITRTATAQYRIVVLGKATSTKGTVQRKTSALVDLNYFGHAMTLAATSGSVTLPVNLTVHGSLYCNRPVTNNATITDSIYATSVAGSGSGTAKTLAQVPGVTQVPSLAGVNHYASYNYGGHIYYPGSISGTLSGTSYGPTSSNPAGIYVCSGDLTVNSNVQVNGTLVVNGELRLKGENNTFTSVDGYPALILDSNLKFNSNRVAMVVNGLVWIGGTISDGTPPDRSTLKINGALISPSAVALFNTGVLIDITYNRKRASVPGMIISTVMPTPTSLTVSEWNNYYSP